LSATLPRQPTLLFGKELARPFGIAPACWTTSRGLISSARLGASVFYLSFDITIFGFIGFGGDEEGIY